ncbi:MAG: MarR family winged helix-turn-helix transcriptional regulator [Nocardioides sp.]
MGADGAGVPTAQVPLARLMAMAARDLIDALHVRLDEEGWHDVRRAYGFVLVRASHGPITVTEVAGLLGITKQAASKLLESIAADDLVVRLDPDRDARSRPFALTDRGRRFLAAAERIYADLESEWAEVIGRDQVEDLRDGLATVLRARHDGQLPPVRPIW